MTTLSSYAWIFFLLLILTSLYIFTDTQHSEKGKMGVGKLLSILPLALLFLLWLFVLLPVMAIFLLLADCNFNVFWGVVLVIALPFSIYQYMKGQRNGMINWKKVVFPLWIYLLLLVLLYISPILLSPIIFG